MIDLESIRKNLGLTALGTAKAYDLNEEYQKLLDWILKGYHGKMEWLARSAKKRCFVSHLMPEPKTVIVAAMKYDDMPERKDDSQNEKPKYLLHQDYHEVMMEKLEALVEEIKKEAPDAKFKCYVDTGPILEKYWAAKSGIGFIGKNTLLIIPNVGSQLALGIVVTNLDLNDQNHFADTTLPASNCGSCTACIDACPRGSLVKPYILDARKCISYNFFIEKREGGCDICQNVCPFNN